jgi:site-specific DNA-methyltransferase (adenine-specific)
MIDIKNESCLDMLKLIEDNSIDLMLTDPPYKIIPGAGSKNLSGVLSRDLKSKWKSNMSKELIATGSLFKHDKIKFSDWLGETFRVLKDGTHAYMMVNDRNLNNLINDAQAVGFKLVNVLFWNKGNVTPNKYYMKAGEFIVLFRKGKARSINNMGSKTLLDFKNIIGKKTHPTEKPVDLLEHLILNSSNEGELVLDPFIGTGSCAVACKNTGRSFIGTELDEEFFKIAEKRIE